MLSLTKLYEIEFNKNIKTVDNYAKNKIKKIMFEFIGIWLMFSAIIKNIFETKNKLCYKN